MDDEADTGTAASNEQVLRFSVDAADLEAGYIRIARAFRQMDATLRIWSRIGRYAELWAIHVLLVAFLLMRTLSQQHDAAAYIGGFLFAYGGIVLFRLLLAVSYRRRLGAWLRRTEAGNGGFPVDTVLKFGSDRIVHQAAGVCVEFKPDRLLWAGETKTHLFLMLNSQAVPVPFAQIGPFALDNLRAYVAGRVNIETLPERVQPSPRIVALIAAVCLAYGGVMFTGQLGFISSLLTPHPQAASRIKNERSVLLRDAVLGFNGRRMDLRRLWYCTGLFDGTPRIQLSGRFFTPGVVGEMAVDKRAAGVRMPDLRAEFFGRDNDALAYAKAPAAAQLARIDDHVNVARWQIVRDGEVPQNCVALHSYVRAEHEKPDAPFGRTVFVKACSPNLSTADLDAWATTFAVFLSQQSDENNALWDPDSPAKVDEPFSRFAG